MRDLRRDTVADGCTGSTACRSLAIVVFVHIAIVYFLPLQCAKSTNLLYSSVMHRMNTLPSSLSRVTVVPSIRQVLTLGARFSEALRRRSEFYILMSESLGQAPSNISQ